MLLIINNIEWSKKNEKLNCCLCKIRNSTHCGLKRKDKRKIKKKNKQHQHFSFIEQADTFFDGIRRSTISDTFGFSSHLNGSFIIYIINRVWFNLTITTTIKRPPNYPSWKKQKKPTIDEISVFDRVKWLNLFLVKFW